MERTSRKEAATSTTEPEVVCSRSAAALVALGLASAWVAAGSGGMLGQGLQRALMWLLFGAMLVSGWPGGRQPWKNAVLLALAALVAGVMTASSFTVVNILAVIPILAAVAYLRGGIDGRAALLGATAVLALAVYRLAFCTFPIVWHVAQDGGAVLGRMVSAATGQPLSIGATFGGIDFLVPMLLLLVLWGKFLQKPRQVPLLLTLAAIVCAQFAYLLLLGCSEKLLASLPDPLYVVENDTSRVGVWAWQNALRACLPWNLPSIALVLQALVAAGMMRWARWLPTSAADLPGLVRQQTRPQHGWGDKASDARSSEVISPGAFFGQLAAGWGPALLAVVLAICCTLNRGKSDLQGKTIVALEKGRFSWSLPQYGKPAENGYGLLSHFVESLGGKFVRVKNLAETGKADLLMILHPNEPLSEKERSLLWEHVYYGGRLLLGAEKGDSSLGQKGMVPFFGSRVRDETVVPLVTDWEQSYEQLNAPATIGLTDLRNPFGFRQGTTLDLAWSARPLVVGRWGWSEPGASVAAGAAPSWELSKPLGDLVLAAEQSFGEGKIAVLGDMSCLSNDVLPTSYEFIGRLLSTLTENSTSDPASTWRQCLGLLLILSIFLFLALRPNWVALTAAALGLAVAVQLCSHASFSSRRVLPGGEGHASMPVAYIDASHLEAFSSRLWNPLPVREDFQGEMWNDFGITGLARTLMRNGFLPLRLPELTEQRLEPAKILISIAPARAFSTAERETVRRFVEKGGAFLCLVGAEHARASAKLLEQFQFTVPPSPVLPGETTREPEPLGSFQVPYPPGKAAQKEPVLFYAAWPVQSTATNLKEYIGIDKGREQPLVVAGRRVGGGAVAVIADTHFASNQNLELLQTVLEENQRFWRWLLPRLTGREAPPLRKEPIPEGGLQEEDVFTGN